jgi:hypothetical protein
VSRMKTPLDLMPPFSSRYTHTFLGGGKERITEPFFYASKIFHKHKKPNKKLRRLLTSSFIYDVKYFTS